MHVLYVPDDPHLYETLQHIVMKAVEGPYDRARIMTGSVNLSCTANEVQTQDVTFPKPFVKGANISLLLFVNPTNPASVVTPSYTNITESGFTAQVYSSDTQDVTLTYVAFGQIGGA
jgi:hypothetical protein